MVKIKVPVVHPDGNYPLAGKALCFALHTNGVQLVTAEEIAHGHENGTHGHLH